MDGVFHFQLLLDEEGCVQFTERERERDGMCVRHHEIYLAI